MINFDNLDLDSLQQVQKANARVDYDLRYSGKTGKFTLSDDAYTRLGMNDNGFNLFSAQGNTPVLSVVPNEHATLHKGRSDADQKGNVFTASSLASMLGLGTDNVEFNFDETEKNGTTWILLQPVNETEEVEEGSITVDESSANSATVTDEAEEMVSDTVEAEDFNSFN